MRLLVLADLDDCRARSPCPHAMSWLTLAQGGDASLSFLDRIRSCRLGFLTFFFFLRTLRRG